MEPLGLTVDLAAALRRITGMALAQESESVAVGDLLRALEQAEVRLRDGMPGDLRPRLGDECRPEQRVYLDHARDIGAYNPCFPEYTIDVAGDEATGKVCFPLAYEGPPGLVHGGFLAVFFDCVVQHHNCDVGVTGKTTSMTVAYRRPTPLLVDLDFSVSRSATERRLSSEAKLTLGDEVLCGATVEAVAGDRSKLPTVSPRRTGR